MISFASIIILDFKIYYEDIVVKQFGSGINIFNIFFILDARIHTRKRTWDGEIVH